MKIQDTEHGAVDAIVLVAETPEEIEHLDFLSSLKGWSCQVAHITGAQGYSETPNTETGEREKTLVDGIVTVLLAFSSPDTACEPWELRAAKKIVDAHWRVPDHALQQKWVALVINQERIKG